MHVFVVEYASPHSKVVKDVHKLCQVDLGNPPADSKHKADVRVSDESLDTAVYVYHA